ncbi:MAG: hypothetical protein RI924_912, partial [Bacteroidota bacterium]
MKKLLFILLLILPGWLMAQNFPEKPNRLVNDYTQTLTTDELAALEQKLVAFDDSSSTQIAVVVINDLEGYDVADYAVRLAEKWGIGQQEKNNGIVLLASLGDRKVSIQTGYGMEGALPDAIARRIIEIAIKPNFKQGDYYTGLDQATDAIIAFTKGEFKNDLPRSRKSKGFPLGLILIIMIIIVTIAKRMGGGNNGQVISGRGASSPFWWLLMGGGG